MESLYTETILDHHRHPRNRGLRAGVSVTHVNPTCGDELSVSVRVEDGTVVDVSHDGVGCSISQASASMMSELVRGRTLQEALEVERVFRELMQSRGQGEPDEDVLQDAVALSGVSRYPARVKCAMLAWAAWKDALVRATSAEGEEEA